MKHFSVRRFLTNSIEFECVGGNSELLLTHCMKTGIPLSGLRATPYGFFASIPAADYRSLHIPAQKAHCILHVTRKNGGRSFLKRLLRHRGVLLGLLAAAVLRLMTQNVIWNMEYYGVDAARQQELSDRLFSYGICQGASVSKELLHDVQLRISAETENRASVSLNFSKGKLTVEATPRTMPPAMLLPQAQDLYAVDNGVIRSAEVFCGTCAVQPGQIVRKGDLLVSSTWPDQTGALQPSPCRARILAYIEKDQSIICPLTRSEPVILDTHTDALALCFGRRRIWLKRGSDPSAVPSQQGVRLLGLALPVTVYRTTAHTVNERTVRLSVEEAERRCRQSLNEILYAAYAQIMFLERSYRYEVTDDAVACTLHLRAIADIAGPDVS